MYRIRRHLALAGLVSITGLLVASTSAVLIPAHAGSFAIREQSAKGLGQAYAGVAAGSGGLSSMFWNPATLTNARGIQSSLIATGILPYANLTPLAGTSPILFPLGPAGNLAPSALLPALYGSFQISDRLWFGLSLNAPNGLANEPNVPSASQLYALKSAMKSAEITPALAYKINDVVSLGASVRFLYLQLSQQNALAPIPAPPLATLKSDAWGIGFKLGATIKPFAGTEIGIAYHSRIDIGTKGTLAFGAPYPVQSRRDHIQSDSM